MRNLHLEDLSLLSPVPKGKSIREYKDLKEQSLALHIDMLRESDSLSFTKGELLGLLQILSCTIK